MHKKKASFIKSFSKSVKRLFRARNIIIISAHKVDHVPVSASMQVLLIVGIVGFFSGTSYLTGSYMTARSALREKDEKIVSTTREKTRIGAEMDMLKHDLTKLSQNGKDLSAYSKFVLDQYVGGSAQPGAAVSALSSDSFFGQSTDKLQERVSYLEGRVQEVTDENDRLVLAIRERTDKKIAYFEDIIGMTGLDSDRLERMATGKSVGDAARLAPDATPAEPNSDETAKKDPRHHAENEHGTVVAQNTAEGGPFIPYDTTSFNDADRELLTNVDRLVVLHDIVKKLPLSQPIADYQMTGPFGKRIDPLNGRWAIHPGLDLAGPAGSHIFCTSPGKVVYAGHRAAYGNSVDVDHGFGIVTRYAHMSKIVVKEGDTLRKGQQIGVQGSTGRSTGPHLHYEVRINDRPVNPIKFLHAGEYVFEN